MKKPFGIIFLRFTLVFSFLFLSYACQQDAQKIEKDLAPALSEAGRAEKPNNVKLQSPEELRKKYATWKKEKIEVQNGRLKFKNYEHYQATFFIFLRCQVTK